MGSPHMSGPPFPLHMHMEHRTLLRWLPTLRHQLSLAAGLSLRGRSMHFASELATSLGSPSLACTCLHIDLSLLIDLKDHMLQLFAMWLLLLQLHVDLAVCIGSPCMHKLLADVTGMLALCPFSSTT